MEREEPMKLVASRMTGGVLFLALGGFALLSTLAQAQSTGNKTVYQCPGTGSGCSFAASTVYVDATEFLLAYGPDLCNTINGILTHSSYPNGVVIDARGIVGTGAPATQDCDPTRPDQGNPFYNVGYNSNGVYNSPSTILLPPGTITIHRTWVLPNNTRLIGEGRNTMLQPDANFLPLDPTTNAFISMGYNGIPSNYSTISPCPVVGTSYICTGVTVEHLKINAVDTNSGAHPQNGIYNASSQDGSYVDDIELFGMGAAGQAGSPGASGVAVSAPNSGPYTTIYYLAADSGTSACNLACPACVVIAAQTRGLHGITCIGNKGASIQQGASAIYVEASNNTVEDVHVEGFWDGIEIEAPGGNPTGNIVVSNVSGAFNGNGKGAVVNSVHICGPNAPSSGSFGTCAIPNAGVTDVTALQIQDYNAAAGLASSAIVDDVTGTAITPPVSTGNATVGIYSLGEAFTVNGSPIGYSRFNTSTKGTVAPTWGVGIAAAPGSCSTPGALYSNNTTIYVCSGSTWQSLVN